jgi:hypothetical protein
MLRGCTGSFPQEGGWDTGVGRSSSIYPNRRIPIKRSLAGEASKKNLAKRELGEFTSMEKCAQLLLIKHIW